MPVSGTVIEVNEDLDAHPDLVNNEPYDSGWMIKIEMKDAAELDALMTVDQYKEHIS
jgi:glycine cleavage system H protein